MAAVKAAALTAEILGLRAIACGDGGAMSRDELDDEELEEDEVAAPISTVPPLPPTGRCLWGLGDPGAAGFKWCAAKVVSPGKAYCRRHLAAAVEQSRYRPE